MFENGYAFEVILCPVNNLSSDKNEFTNPAAIYTNAAQQLDG
jgi:hypothetical protein